MPVIHLGSSSFDYEGQITIEETLERNGQSFGVDFVVDFADSPMPPRKGLCSILVGNSKVFGGYFRARRQQVESTTRYKVSVSILDFAAAWEKSFFILDYRPEFEMSLSNHVGNLLQISGAADPNRNVPFIQGGVSGEDTEKFPWESKGVYLLDELERLCDSKGYRFYFGFGAWTLPTDPKTYIADLHVVPRSDRSQRLPFDLNPEADCTELEGEFQYEVVPPEYNRVIVLGKHADPSLLGKIVPRRIERVVHPIAAGSAQRQFPILDNATAISAKLTSA